ncbi:MAG: YihY/virulence factor BrkB family protein [Bacteroidota bacterium]|nr:YihY/virulence factor BrkB family protein [Bacteroidota bacterium]
MPKDLAELFLQDKHKSLIHMFRKKSKFFIELFKQTFSDFGKDKVLKMASSLAYVTIFALPGLLIIIIWISGAFYNPSEVSGKFISNVVGILGLKNTLKLEDLLIHAKFDYQNLWAKVLAVITLIFSVTGIFGEIQDSINTIWGLRTKPKAGFIKVLINRFLSFSVLISLGFILMVSLVLNAFISGLFENLQERVPDIPIAVFWIVNQVVIFFVLVLLFGAIFKVLPDAKITWRDVFFTSSVSAILFMIGKSAIGFFLQENATVTAYGSAGTVIVLLLWVYYSSVILYLGAEFTQVYMKMKGRHINPNKYAIWVEKQEIAVDSNMEVSKEEVKP